MEFTLDFVIFIVMKPTKHRTPTWEVEYEKRKQLHRGYKVIKHMRLSNGAHYKKATLYKNLSETEAENIIYKLERNI